VEHQAGESFAWGAQLNIGSTAKPYFPTTDRLNVPRLTYQNGGGGCPSLLLEKQSTNLSTADILEYVNHLQSKWDVVNGQRNWILIYGGIKWNKSSYPTSYIPTTSSSATRVADACSKTGISSLIGQTEGDFVDFNINKTGDANQFGINQ
jgi:hypothetical protein